MFVSALPDPTCNSEKSANGGNKQIIYYYYYIIVKKPWKRESIYEAIFKPGTRFPIGGKIGERSEPRGNLGRRKGGHLWAAAGLPSLSHIFRI